MPRSQSRYRPFGEGVGGMTADYAALVAMLDQAAADLQAEIDVA